MSKSYALYILDNGEKYGTSQAIDIAASNQMHIPNLSLVDSGSVRDLSGLDLDPLCQNASLLGQISTLQKARLFTLKATSRLNGALLEAHSAESLANKVHGNMDLYVGEKDSKTAMEVEKSNTYTLRVHPSALTENLSATMDVLSLLARDCDFKILQLDLYFVPRLNSRAIRGLVHLKEIMDSRNGQLKLINVPIPIIHLLENLRLDEYFHGSMAYNFDEPQLPC